MKKIIAFVCALVLMLASLPALAEDAMPREVQIFFENLGDPVDVSQVAYAADHEAYMTGMPGSLLSFTLSRMQYSSFYYYVMDDSTALTVCCLDGKPLAYVFDCNAMDYIGYDEAMHALLMAFPDAYRSAFPQQKSRLDGYDFFTDSLLQSIYDPMSKPLVSDMQDHGQTLVSTHAFPLGGRMAIQLFPKAAYEGMTTQDGPLTPEGNHELSAALALKSEYELVMMSME